ncbi:sulfotransferase [Spirillospora sp. CA-294931]|uniref:sulfotransferase n=1 Tax=Spirillospora sp. CA-294931 TaxID=3240042 RepID=UPI003D8CF0D8
MRITFIVGTGRCGSTLLSRILHAHPEVLSLNEFFTPLRRRAYLPEEPLDGRAFWTLLAEPSPVLDGFVRNGVRLPEQLYPYETGRFGRAGVPALCHMLLPLLTDDPDGLHDALEADVLTWPSRPAPEQYCRLFAVLAERLGRRVVVERSGMSLPLVEPLARAFPEARFVHLYRNGPDSAVSMSHHPGFRLALLLNQAARHVGLTSFEQLTEADVRRLPAHLARVASNRYDPAALLNADLPLPAFGMMWSSLITVGVEALANLAPDRRTTIMYDALLNDPEPELARLAEFIDADPTPEWLRESSTRIDPSRAGSAARLAPDDLAALHAACAPGTQAMQPDLIPGG